MEEEKNNKQQEMGTYSPRRRKNSRSNLKTITLLEKLGRRHESDRNALQFIDKELKKKKTISNITDKDTIFFSNYYLISQIIITVYILINEEIKSILTKETADLHFSILIIIFMVYYISEIIAYSLIIKNYFLNFYFWLDLISIITTLLDIHWFYNIIIEKIGGGKIKTVEDLMKRDESKVFLTIRILRIVRIVRVVRVTKLYMAIEKIVIKIRRKNEEKERIKLEEEEKHKIKEEEESKRKARLFMEEYIKNALTQKVIPKKNSSKFIVNIMKKAFKKCKENNIYPTSPKKIVNIIAKNLGINFKNIQNQAKKEKENEDNKNDIDGGETKEYSLIENKQTIEINIGGDNKENEDNLPISRKISDSISNNKSTKDINFLKKTFLSQEIDENKIMNKTVLQINKNDPKEEEKKLSEILLNRSKQKLIFLILIEVFFFTVFNPSNYIIKRTSLELGLNIFSTFNSENETDFSFYYNLYINKHKNIKTPIIFLKIGKFEYGNIEDVIKLREQERIAYNEKCPNFNTDNNNTNKNLNYCNAVFDYRYVNKLNALLNLIKTILACIIIYFGNFWFSRDLCKMVLDPTDAMVERVKLISENPLQVIHDEEKKKIEKVIEEEKEKEKGKDNENKVICGCNSSNNNSTTVSDNKHLLETEILEKTISKIGALLALSLGDAGAEIISRNMKENSTGDVNPMIPGKKVCAIYGFCDIRNFTGLTEILQEKVMVFVNDIADIVHQCAFEYGGSANKNIGDAFLLVWKFDNKFTYVSKKNNELKVYNCEQVNQICDMALISILKMFAGIEKSKEIKKFKNIEQVIEKFGYNSIKIGFGIHLGWSIEGAIGSNFKIDASYLSPNCNMANTCEEKTKEYGVDLIMTDKFVENLSNEAQKKTRILDICYDEDEPIGFYTMDFDTNEISSDEEDDLDTEFEGVEENKKTSASAMKKIKRFKKRFERRKNIEMATSIPPKKYFWNDYEQGDKDWDKMRSGFTNNFYKYYNEGFDEFHFGDWPKAKTLLEKALDIKANDKPTKRLLNIIKKYNNKKPEKFPKID